MLKVVLISFLLLSGPAFAAEPRKVTLGVELMTRAACPITVREAFLTLPVPQHPRLI